MFGPGFPPYGVTIILQCDGFLHKLIWPATGSARDDGTQGQTPLIQPETVGPSQGCGFFPDLSRRMRKEFWGIMVVGVYFWIFVRYIQIHEREGRNTLGTIRCLKKKKSSIRLLQSKHLHVSQTTTTQFHETNVFGQQSARMEDVESSQCEKNHETIKSNCGVCQPWDVEESR